MAQPQPPRCSFWRFAYGALTYVAALGFCIFLFNEAGRGNWWAIITYLLAGYALNRTANWSSKPGVGDVRVACSWFLLAAFGTLLYIAPGVRYSTFLGFIRGELTVSFK